MLELTLDCEGLRLAQRLVVSIIDELRASHTSALCRNSVLKSPESAPGPTPAGPSATTRGRAVRATSKGLNLALR